MNPGPGAFEKVKRTPEQVSVLLDDVCKRHRHYQIFERGYWLVKGADTGDMTTSIIPILGYFKGRFIDVACKAIEFERWTGWSSSSGGEIVKLEFEDVPFDGSVL